jgi:rsbT co-antagonist protein RsbR
MVEQSRLRDLGPLQRGTRNKPPTKHPAIIAPMGLDLDSVLDHAPGLLFVCDAEGKLLRRSKTLVDRLGDRLQHDSSLMALVGPDERASVEAFLAELTGTDKLVTRVLQVPGMPERLRCVGRRAPDGLIHGQLEPLADEAPERTSAARVEHSLFRTIMETLDIVLWAIDDTGKFVFHDGKALATAGMKPGQLLGLNIFDLYPPDMMAPIKQALAGTPSGGASEVHGVHWQSWYIPVRSQTGETEHVAGLTLDISDAVRTKHELERRLATIENQQRAIHELSAPVINVWDNVLTVPLIGVMDTQRANELIERLLTAASRSGTRYVILDLTGVDSLDTAIAGHLLRLLQSLRLLGVEGMVTGISPQVAQTMVGLGVELEDVRTFRSLRESLRYCMKAMYAEQSAG